VGEAWTGFIWLRIGISSGQLCALNWSFGFNKMWGNAWLVQSVVPLIICTLCTTFYANVVANTALNEHEVWCWKQNVTDVITEGKRDCNSYRWAIEHSFYWYIIRLPIVIHSEWWETSGFHIYSSTRRLYYLCIQKIFNCNHWRWGFVTETLCHFNYDSWSLGLEYDVI
jgi:hypothetical protein